MSHSGSRRSLKFKLMSLSMGITFILGVAATGILTHLSNTSEKGKFKTFLANAQALNDAVGAQLFERYYDVQSLAKNPVILSSSRATIVSALNQFVDTYNIYDLILIVDAKGRLVAVNDRDASGKPIQTQSLYDKTFNGAEWFKAALAGQFSDDKSKNYTGTFVDNIGEDPLVSAAYGERRVSNGFSTQIKDSSGNVVGVISNRANPMWFGQAFMDVIDTLRGMDAPQSQASLVDKQGKLLFEYSMNPGSTELPPISFNFERALKLNYLDRGYKPAQDFTQGKTGAMYAPNGTTGEVQMAGYTPFHGPKSLDALGWNFMIRDSRAEIMAELNQAKLIFYAVFLVIMLAACFASAYFSTSLSRTLTAITTQLSEGSKEVSSASSQISTSSVELSEAATEQAAAIQQTAASVDQVSAMVKKSAENAAQSQKASASSREAATQGQAAIQEMIQSINDISRSNSDIMKQVEEGNARISEIVKVISEIGTKTKVINDIVFQTKLLSFNASVEAARAGEQGKGFAVVAEEVGNLAQMSGTAAKEISSMLDSSIQKVEGIVNETKSKVESLIVDSRSKVENGTQVASRCGETLGKIITSVQQVDGMVAEIASASGEQAQGVNEINGAMNQLNQVTHRNTAVAQAAASASKQLSDQAGQLKHMVSELFNLVNGGKVPAGEVSELRIDMTQAPRELAPVVPIREKAVATTQPKPARAPQAKAQPRPHSGSRTATATALGSARIPSKDDSRFEDV